MFHKRGAYAGRALARVVRNFDDGDGRIDKQELAVGLRSYLGFEMDKQDFDHVWAYFDTDDSGDISVDEFLTGIRGNLNHRRMKAVTEAYEKLDRDSSGDISLNEIESHYDVTHHPKVMSGEWSRKEALEDFLKQWDANADASVSKEEFIDFFKDVSLGIDENEDFIKCMRNIFPTLAPPVDTTWVTPREDGFVGEIVTRTPEKSSKVLTPKEVRERAADIDAVRNIKTPTTGQRSSSRGGGQVEAD